MVAQETSQHIHKKGLFMTLQVVDLCFALGLSHLQDYFTQTGQANQRFKQTQSKPLAEKLGSLVVRVSLKPTAVRQVLGRFQPLSLKLNIHVLSLFVIFTVAGI